MVCVKLTHPVWNFTSRLCLNLWALYSKALILIQPYDIMNKTTHPQIYTLVKPAAITAVSFHSGKWSHWKQTRTQIMMQ